LTRRRADPYDGLVADRWDEETTATELVPDGMRTPDRDRATLTVLTGSATGKMFKVGTSDCVIGRVSTAEIHIEDDGVSRHHARVRCADGKAFVVDLGSRNGTFVNGIRIADATELHDNDKVQVGRATVLRFAFHDALHESFHENLLSSALRDGLTKLFNKRYLMERLDSELKFAHRHETSVALLMLDLDHFKAINDANGHLAGDAVLAHVAALIARAVRNEDVVARFGGEEFAIVLRAIGVEGAMNMAERLRKLVELSAVTWNEREQRVTVSIGVACFPSTTTAKTPDILVEAADQALYRAKHAGRNRVAR
jgi:diguanylate cyclase (GGDEF)-like protein